MFTLIRTSSTPASPLCIQVSQPDGDEAGLTLGGSFYFQPAGTEAAAAGEDRALMSECAAREILRDPVYGPHFTCVPPLPVAVPVSQPAAEAPVEAPPSSEAVVDDSPRRRRG